jgi:hypothetical protein
MEEGVLIPREAEVDTCSVEATSKAARAMTASASHQMATSASDAKRKVIMSMTALLIMIKIMIQIANRECHSPPSINLSF